MVKTKDTVSSAKSKSKPSLQKQKKISKYSRLNLQELFFLGMLIAASVLFLKVISVFFISLLFAVMLTLFFYRQYSIIEIEWQWGKRLAASVVIFEVFALITVPAMVIGYMLSIEASSGYRHFEENMLLYQQRLLDSEMLVFLREWGVTKDIVQEIDSVIHEGRVMQSVSDVLSRGLQEMAALAQKAFVNMSSVVFQFVISLYIFYFLLTDGKKFLDRVVHLLPMPEAESMKLLSEMMRTSKATVVGTIVIGILEGIYGGLLFAFFDVQSPVLWGCVMTILSLLPLVGTNAILLPAGIFRLVIGDWLTGVVFLVFGCGLIIVSQNVIRPKLVSDQAGVHPAIIVISTVGGIAWLGLIGFLVGPIVASLAISLWNQFGERYNRELKDWLKQKV